MKPVCVVCGRNVTWSFYLCADCEEEWGRRKADRPKWLTYLINEERMRRYNYKKQKEYEVSSDNADYISYSIDLETLVEYRLYYAGWMIEDTDGNLFEFKDSDWEAVYTWSV